MDPGGLPKEHRTNFPTASSASKHLKPDQSTQNFFESPQFQTFAQINAAFNSPDDISAQELDFGIITKEDKEFEIQMATLRGCSPIKSDRKRKRMSEVGQKSTRQVGKEAGLQISHVLLPSDQIDKIYKDKVASTPTATPPQPISLSTVSLAEKCTLPEDYKNKFRSVDSLGNFKTIVPSEVGPSEGNRDDGKLISITKVTAVKLVPIRDGEHDEDGELQTQNVISPLLDTQWLQNNAFKQFLTAIKLCFFDIANPAGEDWESWSNKHQFNPHSPIIFIPLHRPWRNHWVLLHFRRDQVAATCYDSLQIEQTESERNEIKQAARALIKAFGEDWVMKHWTLSFASKVPQQHDNSTCGVYVLVTCLYVSCQQLLPERMNDSLWRVFFEILAAKGTFSEEQVDESVRLQFLSSNLFLGYDILQLVKDYVKVVDILLHGIAWDAKDLPQLQAETEMWQALLSTVRQLPKFDDCPAFGIMEKMAEDVNKSQVQKFSEQRNLQERVDCIQNWYGSLSTFQKDFSITYKRRAEEEDERLVASIDLLKQDKSEAEKKLILIEKKLEAQKQALVKHQAHHGAGMRTDRKS